MPAAATIIAARSKTSHDADTRLADAIGRSLGCAQACIACADACLSEVQVNELRQCIRLNLDCADICISTASILSRRTGDNHSVIIAQLGACVLACRQCAEECGRHDHMDHCQSCARICEECESTCQAYLESVRDAV